MNSKMVWLIVIVIKGFDEYFRVVHYRLYASLES